MKDLEQGEHKAEDGGSESGVRQGDIEGSGTGKLSPGKKRRAVRRIMEVLQVSERRSCRTLEQPRSTRRQVPRVNVEEDRLSARITERACQHGRYGYIRISALLQADGWRVK